MNPAAKPDTAKIAFDDFKGVKPLLSLYSRLCPKDQLTEEDPRFPCIAAEMVAVGRAPDANAAFEVIRWWDNDESWARAFIRDARRSLCRMKLERYSEANF